VTSLNSLSGPAISPIIGRSQRRVSIGELPDLQTTRPRKQGAVAARADGGQRKARVGAATTATLVQRRANSQQPPSAHDGELAAELLDEVRIAEV
jgi:hypothetical protein